MPLVCYAHKQVAALQAAVAAAVGRPVASFKMVHKGSTLENQEAAVRLSGGDSLLVVPNRKAPSPSLVRAAIAARSGSRGAEEEEEEEDEPAQLPPSAWAWEHKVGTFM